MLYINAFTALQTSPIHINIRCFRETDHSRPNAGNRRLDKMKKIANEDVH